MTLLIVILVLVTVPALSASTQDPPTAVVVNFNTSSAKYITLGYYSGATVNVTNSWVESMSIVVFATFRGNTEIYVAAGTATIGPNQTVQVFSLDLQTIPPGVYGVSFAAVTIIDQAVSAPTTPISIVVSP